MAETKFKTEQEAQAKLVTALQENSRKLRQAYQDKDQTAIDKYSKEYDRLSSQYRASSGIGNVGAGVASTAVGLLTGLPDLAIAGYNLYQEGRTPSMSELVTGKKGLFGEQAGKLPSLREKVLDFAGIPSSAVAQENELSYAAPDIATGAVGLYQLGKLGVQGLKGWLQGRQTKELLSKLSPDEQNFFKDLMLKGQGSPNTEVAAKIAKLEADPKYAELFNALKREASVRATAGMAPEASRITNEQAGTGAALGVKNWTDKLAGLVDGTKTAGSSSFEAAKGYAEGKQLVDPVNTLKQIDGLIGRYSKQTTPNAERAVEVLQALKDRISSVSAPSSPFAGVGGGVQPSKLKTVDEVQGILSEFGKKASAGDSLIKDLAISDERIISSAIFGGMKDDLRAAYNTATGSDKAALGFLRRARDEVSTAVTKYNDAIAQGIPAWLKDKPLNSISFEDLFSQYKNATPTQRATFRTYVQNTDPEALKNFDGQIWKDFSSKYATELADGMPGTDLARMAKDWVKTPEAEKDAIASALGQNLSEFDKRMKDALVFTRKVTTGQPQGDGAGLQQLTREASAVVGASPAGYSGAKATQLVGDVLGMFTKGGISNELAMKTLLTPEGAAFLKNARLSPGSAETLKALTALKESPSALGAAAAVGTSIAPNEQGATSAPASPASRQWIDPDSEDTSNDNVKKFLDIISSGESGGDYNVIVGGGRFSDMSKHPGVVGVVTDKGPSTAAGRYQITQSTYGDLSKKMGVNDFSPATQDAMAIQLLKDRGAYEDVVAGNFDVAKNKLKGTWDSFNKPTPSSARVWVDPDA